MSSTYLGARVHHFACSWEMGKKLTIHTVHWFACEMMSTAHKLTQLSPGGGAVLRGYQRLGLDVEL